MSKLKEYRKRRCLRLREVAEKIGVTPATVHDAEVRGLRTPRSAQRYAAAFPGVVWWELLEIPEKCIASDGQALHCGKINTL